LRGRGYKGYNQLLHPGYGWIEADFEETIYDWNNTTNYLNSSSTTEEVEAVATLIFHCGVSIWMHYGNDFSWALPSNLPDGIVDNFRYREATLKKRKNYSDSQWKQRLRDELDNSRPVIYYGDDGYYYGPQGYQSSFSEYMYTATDYLDLRVDVTSGEQEESDYHFVFCNNCFDGGMLRVFVYPNPSDDLININLEEPETFTDNAISKNKKSDYLSG
jgi:hypothetical protein